ncbi:S-adenosylmethionine:tRNA ribosyltransferase-isomerase [Flavilitoribacter nigricans]|uniref:Queuosine biosynthesis protein n=1 Tax=Flavilitoribacter nigricans (strain ATCC 23147 / DSM 23189 / NBRC 102662 / NCIMB 1420 / SS-2) TaxID=1122177 RepID=A0A2D0MY44_FLAN2|nr:S-adenosylmethionine:tRNA ribosyltransferase-isomerase [Flavilitoribacter nigricans]PHN01046.1 queuosine biosynthesis protein [Flavilitoribacter nigricans DSM 23189 = NBRC 102662]
MQSPTISALDFELPVHLSRPLPTESRGLERDAVKLLVSKMNTDSVFHTTFAEIDRFLQAGDVLVVNTSATVPAALDIVLPTGRRGKIHLSNQISDTTWRGELREIVQGRPKRYFLGQAGAVFPLPGGGTATLLDLHSGSTTDTRHLQLWEIRLDLPLVPLPYLHRYGKPIRYDEQQFPLEYYQTAFSTEAGSAEMPSAGRAFTHPLITRLLIKGVQFAPITLHTGVSSLETDEEPFPEFFRVPAITASLINTARQQGRRIIAVGTTAGRAVESAVDRHGQVREKEGWTELYIKAESGMQIITGLITGFHEPRASHLHMLEALAGRHHLEIAYRAALERDYLWHEFGDLHLIV